MEYNILMQEFKKLIKQEVEGQYKPLTKEQLECAADCLFDFVTGSVTDAIESAGGVGIDGE